MIADEDVANFISMTSAGADEARGYLEMAGGNMEQAMNLFLEMGGAHAPPAASRPAGGGGGTGRGHVVDADVAAEVAAAAAAAGIDTSSMMQDHAMGDGDGDGVRAPIAAFQDQIINPEHERRRMQEAIQADSAAMSRRMTFDRPPDVPGAGAGGEPAEDGKGPGERAGQAINQLFAPPEYNESQPYYQLIEKAKAEGKWVLVNIQQAEVFASHTLNRDVWSDDTIKDIISGSFLFWQRDDKSTEGDQFCQYYQCGHQLPHVCIVDPRTGRRVKSWDGRKWVEAHAAAEYLFGFLDEFSMSRSPPALSPNASPNMKPQVDPAPPGGASASGGGGEMRLVGLDEVMGPAPAAAVPAEDTEMARSKEPPCAMPEEPPESAQHVKVSFRLPSGQRVARRFPPTAPLEDMFAVASALTNEPLALIDLAMQFPTRSLRDVAGGLKTKVGDAQVAGNMVLVNVRSS